MKQLTFTILTLMALLMTACDKKPSVEKPTDPILAKVGKSTINQSQYDLMLSRLSPEARNKINNEKSKQLQDKILKGLVRTRALAIITEEQLSADEKQLLETKVQAYKDELLAQMYIKTNMDPEPVTSQMVTEYYDKHKQDFTLPGKVQFEYLVTTKQKLNDKELSKVIKAFTDAKKAKDLKAYAKTLKRKKLPLEYKSGQMTAASIVKVIRSQVERLKEGEVSDVVYADYIYVVKVNKREPDVVKPVNQVSIEIRKKLAPQKLKQALSTHIDEAMKKVKVEYIN